MIALAKQQTHQRSSYGRRQVSILTISINERQRQRQYESALRTLPILNLIFKALPGSLQEGGNFCPE